MNHMNNITANKPAVSQNINTIVGSGRLGADPTIRYVDVKGEAKPVTEFSVAVYISEDNTDWYRVQCWGNLATIAVDRLKKGSKVSFEGRLKIDEYEKDGELYLNTIVVASEINF